MKITFIGLGEAASAFVSGWAPDWPHSVSAYDIKSTDNATTAEIRQRAERLGVRNCLTPKDALQGAEIVFCTVTADQAAVAAEAYSPFIQTGAVWCDLNSCAPDTKRVASGLVEAAGGVCPRGELRNARGHVLLRIDGYGSAGRHGF